MVFVHHSTFTCNTHAPSLQVHPTTLPPTLTPSDASASCTEGRGGLGALPHTGQPRFEDSLLNHSPFLFTPQT